MQRGFKIYGCIPGLNERSELTERSEVKAGVLAYIKDNIKELETDKINWF